MPVLTSIAQRLNDIEINNNAPVSSQTQRRVASSVNFLLDLVGAADSSTSTSGDLGTLLQPKQILNFNIAAQDYSQGYTQDLFTFTGDGNRHLSWVEKSNGYCLTSDANGGFDPVFKILRELLNKSSISVFAASTITKAQITVNNIVFGSITNTTTIGFNSSQRKDIVPPTFNLRSAPVGVNTVRFVVPILAAPQNTQIFRVNNPINLTFEKIFI